MGIHVRDERHMKALTGIFAQPGSCRAPHERGWAKNPYVGKLCPRRHDYNGTGQSLLRKTNHLCLACDRERAQERRQAKQ